MAYAAYLTIDHSRKLLENAYWERVWIVQELLLANRIVLLFGPFTMPWSVFSGLCAYVTRTRATNSPGFPGPNVRSLWLAQRAVQESERKELFWSEISDTLCANHCGDPRDKVYGFQGLVERPVAPDYGKSTEEVFLDAVERLLEDWTNPGEPAKEHVRAALKLGAQMLPETMAIHAAFDRIGALNEAVDAANNPDKESRSKIVEAFHRFIIS